MKTLQIEITKEDVENANALVLKEQITKCCPTHHALRRYLNTEFEVAYNYAVLGPDYQAIAKWNNELFDAIFNYGPTKQEFPTGTYEIQVDEQYLKEEYR